MDSNTHSTQPPELPDGLAGLAVVVDVLAGRDLDRLTDAALAEQVLQLRRLVDGLDGQWLRRLAAIDARGAAGPTRISGLGRPPPGCVIGSAAAPGAARSSVGTARALFCGPLAGAAPALVDGVIAPAHARVLADGTGDLPAPGCRRG